MDDERFEGKKAGATLEVATEVDAETAITEAMEVEAEADDDAIATDISVDPSPSRGIWNPAMTDISPATTSVHTWEPAHAPDQPSKTAPDAGCAVSVMESPVANVPEHPVAVHASPFGTLVTVAPPTPAKEMVTA